MYRIQYYNRETGVKNVKDLHAKNSAHARLLFKAIFPVDTKIICVTYF